MSNIRHLSLASKPTLPIDDDLIEGLEALLGLARKGDIQGLAYVTVRTNGSGHYETIGTGLARPFGRRARHARRLAGPEPAPATRGKRG